MMISNVLHNSVLTYATAKAFLASPPPALCPESSLPHFLGNPVSVSIAGAGVTKCIQKALTGVQQKENDPLSLTAQPLDQGNVDLVDWNAIGSAQGRESQNFWTRMAKMMNDWRNVGKPKRRILERFKTGEDPDVAAKCPCCLQVEIPIHVWQCLSTEMREASALEFWRFWSFMAPVKISSLLMQCLFIELCNVAF